MKKIMGIAAIALFCTSSVVMAKPKDKPPKPSPTPAPAPTPTPTPAPAPTPVTSNSTIAGITLVPNKCFAANTSQGCKFTGIINSQTAADGLETLYNGLHADINLRLLDKMDLEDGPLAQYLTNVTIKDDDPNEITAATFTRSGWVIDFYAVKAGTEAVLYAVNTPASSFSFNMSSLDNKGISHLVLFGREGNVPNEVVPEPATWAMMLGGFGLLGAAMRRRRTRVVFA